MSAHFSSMYSYTIPGFSSPDGSFSIEERTLQCTFREEPDEDSVSVGAEIEMAVVGRRDGQRLSVCELLERRAFNGAHDAVQIEVSPDVLEVNIQPGGPEAFQGNFRQALSELFNGLHEESVTIFPFGKVPTHGVEQSRKKLWESLHSHYNPHYMYLPHRDGEALMNLDGLCALQAHYQQRDARLALPLARGLSYLVPYFSALSASSPIHDGAFRGYRSERTIMRSKMPYAHLPPDEALGSLSGLRSFITKTASEMRTVSPGYYDIRAPRVEIGTVENCSMDCVPSVDHALDLIDLNTHACKRICTAVQNGEELPVEFFNGMELSPNDRAWVKSMKIHLLTRARLDEAKIIPPDGSGNARPFPAMLSDLMEWAGCPADLRGRVEDFIEQGTYAERIIDSLELDPFTEPDSGSAGVRVDHERILETYGAMADAYSKSLRTTAS